MANMVKITSYDNEVDVLLNPKVAHSISVLVNNTGVTAKDGNGNLYIPAGTPVGHATAKVLKVRNTVLSVMNGSTDGKNAQGILRHDVVFRNGNTTENATLIVSGVVDSSKCPTIDPTAETALTHIIFQNGGKE